MPKERRMKTNKHAPSVKIPASHVDVLPELLDNQVPSLENTAMTLSKKDKQIIKRESFLQKLEIRSAPYSKSHTRRMKRKAREDIAGGLSDMQTALSALEETFSRHSPSSETLQHNQTSPNSTINVTSSSLKASQIGQGKNAPLSKNQRKRALELERLRQSFILTNPDFSAGPFQTIRTHAKNTLLKHRVPERVNPETV